MIFYYFVYFLAFGDKLESMYESYQTIKYFHVVTVILSLAMFAIRSLMMVSSKGNYKHRYWRLATAFNDSLLLVFGGYLSYINSVVWQLSWFQEKMAFSLFLETN